MPIIKCKMCGEDLRIEEGSTVCECEYCGTRQTVPSADNEKKLTLFSRAGRLLRGCEFDKAAGVFETIVADFPEEAEAYWGLVLCKYGIEYVDDPATGKKIPTCHRSSFDSVLDDPNYEQACENTDAIARRVYRDEARQIEDLRKQIIEVSGKEEPYDIFISYKETDEHGDRTLDSVIAQDIYTELTEKGYRVFFSRISLEDKLGTEYEPYIFAALNSAKVMLVVGTDYENYDAVWVKNEWSRFLKLIASGQKKTLIPVFKNMDAYDMPKEFAKLAAQDMGKVGAMQDLVRGVEKLVRKKENTVKETVKETVVVQGEGDMKTIAAVKRGRLAMEGGEFERAKEFFEQALTLDAECAEAYWGIALADEKCPDEKTYISRACGQNVSAERISLPPDTVRIAKCVDSCAVEGYLSPEKLQDLFRFDRNYTTYVKARVLNAQQQKEIFQKNRNFSRAFRFAAGETLERMNAFQNQLFGELDQNVSLSREHAETARQEKADAYLKHLAEAEEKAEILHSEAEKKREDDYLIACKMQESAETIDQYQTVIRRYTDIGDYQDCKERIEQCRAAAKVIENQERLRKEEAERKTALEKAEAERERKKEDYQRLVKNFEGTTERDELEALEKQFLAFGEYEDAQVMAKRCEEQAERIERESKEEAERKRLEVERTAKAAAAKKKRTIGVVLALVVAAVSAFQINANVIVPGNAYKEAEALLSAGQYNEAIAAFEALGEFRDSQARIKEAYEAIHSQNYAAAEALLANGDKTQAAICFGKAAGYKDARERSFALWDEIAQRDSVAAGGSHTVGLKVDGTVVAVGNSVFGQCEIGGWTNIVAVVARSAHTIGLKADGTVVAVGFGGGGVSSWKDVVTITAGSSHTIGLKADGTVLAEGYNDYGQCDVTAWTDIVAVAAGNCHTVGLKVDGTVVAVGNNSNGQCDISRWTDIVAIAAGGDHTVGLKADGTVVAVGNNSNGQCDISRWTDIVAIAVGGDHTVGLKKNGSVVAVGDNSDRQSDVSDWTDIVAVAAGSSHTVGLKADGTVVAVGNNDNGQCKVSGWKNIKLPNT